jgi:glycosyltransferase involved in cell wall biosynthesis
MVESVVSPGYLKERFSHLRGDPAVPPDATLIIPVNAQKDLAHLQRALFDLSRYSSSRKVEIILVINNYSADEPPGEIRAYQQMGLVVIAIPHVEHEGGIAMAARIPGVRIARSQVILHFDADCRIPNPDALIDWYVSRLMEGYALAYTHVDYTDLPPGISVKARMLVHHVSRWFRRRILGIPTSRGSNYAIRRDLMLDLFARGRIPYDIHVGPVVKSIGGKIAYSGAKELLVLTSGRFFSPGWKVLFSYLIWRTGYYFRILKMKPKKAVSDR